MKNLLLYNYFDPSAYWLKLNAYPREITYFICGAILLIVLSFLIMIVLYARRWHQVIRDKRRKDLRFRYQYFIYDALVESKNEAVLSSTTLIINKFKNNELKNKEQKQLMIDLIIELKKSFSGNAKKQFQQLYVCLGLHHESIAKLNSRRVTEKAKGVRELSEIAYHCPQLEHSFIEWQNSSNTLLSDEVKIAAIRMASPHMLNFLKQQKSPLSEWIQFQLSHQLKFLPSESVPLFSQWLSVEEPTALVFLLRMIALFRQTHEIATIATLLYHADDEVKLEAVNTLEALEAGQYLSDLFNVLDTTNEALKIKAIQAIGNLGHIFHANLLMPFLHQQSPRLIEATKEAIANIQARSAHPTKKLYSHTSQK